MKTFASVALLSAALLALPAYGQDKLYGTNADTRIGIALKVAPEVVQKLVPAGWESNPSPAGANLVVVLVNSISAEDAEGKPAKPNTGIALVVPAKKSGSSEAGPMVVGGLFQPHYAPGAYDVFMPAKVTIDRKMHTVDGKTNVEETWNLKGEDGKHSLLVKVNYVRSDVKKVKAETKVYSGAKPDFYRIYRVEQGTEAVKDAKVSIKATGPKLASVLDGKQQVVAVTSIPWYSRAVSLPQGK